MRETPSRIAVNAILKNELQKIGPQNLVLDIGAKDTNYKQLIHFKEYKTLDIVPSYRTDIVADVHEIPIADSSVDLVLMIEVLEHCEDPKKVISEIYRILNPDGLLILSTRFLFPKHNDPKDFYRFTDTALLSLTNSWAESRTYVAGGFLTSILMMCMHLLPVQFRKYNAIPWRHKNIPHSNTKFACGYVLVAKK